MLNFPVELNYLQSRVKGKIRSLYESHKIDHKEQIEQLRVSICTNMQEGIKSKVSKGVARPLADMADDYVRPYLQEALKVISKNVMGKVLSERAKENLVRLEEKFGEKSKEYLDNIRSAIGKEESYEDMYNRRSEEIAKHQAKINKKYEQRQLNGIRGASPAESMTPEVSYISPRISGVAAGDSYGKESKYPTPRYRRNRRATMAARSECERSWSNNTPSHKRNHIPTNQPIQPNHNRHRWHTNARSEHYPSGSNYTYL